MEKIQEREKSAGRLGLKKAVVQLKPGESSQEAWDRHLKEHPEAALATLRIFRPSSCLTELQSVEHG